MASDDLCRFAKEAVLERLEAMMAEVEGVRAGDDIEHVHRMRVASRRLRSALRIFKECFPGKKGRSWRSEAREVTRSLGEARDLDVQIAFLERTASQWGEARIGLDEIILHLREGRASLQPAIRLSMDGLEREGSLTSLLSELREGERGDIALNKLHPYAYAHAAAAVDEMFEHARSVPDERDWEGHHALRIAGKHLRYSLEAFRKAYGDRLENELRTMKRLQDVVGELHDIDVWLQRLPELLEDVPSARDALGRLGEELIEARKGKHAELVMTWYELEQDRFFPRLLQRLKGDVMEEACPVRVAIMADVHGNALALEAVMADARRRGVTAFLNAGDTVGLPWTGMVIASLADPSVLSVRGNIDQASLDLRNGGGVRDAQVRCAAESLGEEEWGWLEDLPEEVRLNICGHTLLLVHAAPGSLSEKILPTTPESRLLGLAREAGADVVVTGHTHIPMVRKAGATVFVNPGSVGRPRNGPGAEYATIDFPTLEIAHHVVRYDYEAAASDILRAGFPEQAAEVREGRKADRVGAVRDWALALSPDRDHVEQVLTLSLLIFDRTRGLHRLPSKYRELLEMAALSHDVGLSAGAEGHQRRALDLVMRSGLPLDLEERMIVACVARYHGCRPPRDDDKTFRDLGKKARLRVRKLASILAIADAMDRAHDGKVQGVRVEAGKDRVRLIPEGRGPFTLEREWVGHKQCQFEKVFRRRVELDE